MGIGKAGAKNAGVLAAKILALENKEIANRLVQFKADMVAEVEAKAKRIGG